MNLRLNSFILWLILVIILSGCTPVLSFDIKQSPTVIQTIALPFPAITKLPATVALLPSQTATSISFITPLPIVVGTTFIFISETIPDGTNIQPGQAFQKTWTIKNGSSSTWEESYVLVRTSSSPTNESLNSLEQIPLSKEVKPGETIQIGVDLVAPKQNGQYTVFYYLQDSTGGPVPNSQVWVTITVGSIHLPGSDGITAQLLTASTQNAEFMMDFCMQLPDGRQWYPWDVILYTNQKEYSPISSRIDPVGATTANKCFSFRFPVSIYSGATYQLSIGKVELPPEVHQAENCANAQTILRGAYPGLDFKCAGAGSWYTNLVLPYGMTEKQADQLILDAMSSSIYGPWILNGIVP